MTAGKPSLQAVSKLLDVGHMSSDTDGIGMADSDPVVETAIRLNLDQLAEYDRNPRKARNVEYDTLKESLRSTGASSVVLVVTKRPGEAHYFPKMGGNTRIHALKELYAETGDERFYWLDCKFQPYTNEADLLVGHLAENDHRGDYIFLDRARGVRAIQEQLEAADGNRLSQVAFVKRLSELGYKLSRTALQRFDYALDQLYPCIPLALEGGMVENQATKIHKLRIQFRAFRERIFEADDEDAVTEADLDTIFEIALADLDDEAGIDPKDVQDAMLRQMAVALGAPASPDGSSPTEERLRNFFSMFLQNPTSVPAWRHEPEAGGTFSGSDEGTEGSGFDEGGYDSQQTQSGSDHLRPTDPNPDFRPGSHDGGRLPRDTGSHGLSPGPAPVPTTREYANWRRSDEEHDIIRQDAHDAARRIALHYGLGHLLRGIPGKGYGFYIDASLEKLTGEQADIWWWLFRTCGLAKFLWDFIQVSPNSNYAKAAAGLLRTFPDRDPREVIREMLINALGSMIDDRPDREVFLKMPDEVFQSFFELTTQVRRLIALDSGHTGRSGGEDAVGE